MRSEACFKKTRALMKIALSLFHFPSFSAVNVRSVVGSFMAFLGVAGVASCSTTPSGQLFASRRSSDIDPRYGVRPSPRVVADGEPAPKGGGGYMVGKPYQIAGRTYYPSERPVAATGIASYYGSDFHGRKTANGEVFDRTSISAAHPTMPLPSYARVTNLRNAHSIVVRVNDRGPYHGGRLMDVSQRVAEALEFKNVGTAPVRVEWLGRASLAGSDDEKLLASLRQDGHPATLDGVAPVMVAERDEPVRTAMLERPGRPAVPLPPVREDEDDASAPATTTQRGGKEADATASIGAKTSGAQRFASAPVPPTRPFDLGASGNALKAGRKQAMN
jgi:rare lipoprotein A